MDPISASSFNLNANDDGSVAKNNRAIDEYFTRILGSTKSLSRYEKRNLKNLRPQIIAAIIAASAHVVVGVTLSFSAIMIPQLLDESSDIKVTLSETSWIASVMVLISPFGSLLSGFMMERLGRLNTLKWATLPGIVGWIAMALAWNVPMIIISRLLLGLSSNLATNPAVVYITEIARKDMRGSLISLGPTLVSLGMLLTYVKGWLIGWRMLSWFGLVYTIIPFFLLFLIDESPVYLISKNRPQEAKKSLQRLHQHQPQPDDWEESFADIQFQLLMREHHEREAKLNERGKGINKIEEFMKPTGYKPLLILTGLFFFQQFSGVYIFLFYSVTFFEDVGSSWNPYAASILIGVIRLVMSLGNTWLLKNHKRRVLVMLSASGMALCTLTSGLYTYWIKNDMSNARWVPVVFLLLYTVFSMVGLLSIPWTMTAELFPLEIRSTAHSISISLVNVIMFVAVQNFTNMKLVLGGSDGVQLLFATISALAVLYTWIFLPETHGKKLSEIQEYFEQNTIYLNGCGGGKTTDKTNNGVQMVFDDSGRT